MENHLDAPLVIRALGALAQDHRLATFRLLVQAGEQGLPAGTIAEKLGLPPSSLSFHLTQLVHAGLIAQRRASRSIIYTANYATMQGLLSYLTENCCGGMPCAETLPQADACCPPILSAQAL